MSEGLLEVDKQQKFYILWSGLISTMQRECNRSTNEYKRHTNEPFNHFPNNFWQCNKLSLFNQTIKIYHIINTVYIQDQKNLG